MKYFKKEDLKYLFFLTPYAVLYFLISTDFLFTGGDEFSHWASSIKFIYITNGLWVADSPIMFKHYPPSQQMFQYFFVKSCTWSEKNVLFSQGIFLISGLLSIISIGIKKQYNSVLLLFSYVLIIYFLGFDFGHIFVDALLGVTFASIFMLTTKKEKSNFDYLIICITTATLLLMKETGLIFSCIALVSFVINEKYTTKFQYNKSKVFFRSILPTLCLLLSMLIAYKSWGIYCKSIGAKQTHSIPNLKSFFQGEELKRLGLTVTEFINRISNPYWHIPFSILQYSLLFTGIGLLIVILEYTQKRTRTALEILSLTAGFYFYIIFLLIAYLVFFGDYEGVRLASFERYTHTFVLAWILILCVYVISLLENRNQKLALIATLGILGTLLFIGKHYKELNKDIKGIKPPADLMEVRKKVDLLTDIVKKHMKSTDVAYFISQDSRGYEAYMFKYTMIPYKTSVPLPWSFSFGKRYNSNDVWSSINRKMRDAVADSDYLVVYYSDKIFWEENKDLFEPFVVGSTYGVYRIIKENSHIVTFKKLE